MRKVLIAALAAATLMLGALPAQAHVGPEFRLRFFSGDTGSAHWQLGTQDSPLDTNNVRLKLNVPEQTGNDYAGAFARRTGINNRPVDGVRNLSFDFRDLSFVGAGSPRISVEVDTNGDDVANIYAYLSAFYCQADIGTPEDGWSRADFTGRISTGCSFYDSTGAIYSSTGTESAWSVFADAHAGAVVLDAYVVADEVGTSFVDRVAFHAHMFVRQGDGAGAIKHCPSESAC